MPFSCNLLDTIWVKFMAFRHVIWNKVEKWKTQYKAYELQRSECHKNYIESEKLEF